MQQVNDDMDELYRKAGENYPLNTNTADWEKLRKKLTGIADEPVVTIAEKKKNYRTFLLLLLLIPAGLIGYRHFAPRNNDQVKTKLAATQNAGIKDPVAANQSSLSKKEDVEVKKLPPAEPSLNRAPAIVINNTQQPPARRFVQHNRNSPQRINGSRTVSVVKATSSFSKQTQDNSVTTPPTQEEATKPGLTAQKSEPANRAILPAENKITGEDTIQQKKNDEVVNNTRDLKAPVKGRKERFFYAGIMIAPDVSTVKMQAIKNTGLNLGVLVGYKINKKLSVESGVMFDKKYYYSDGKYFNTTKINLPATAKITTVNGNCKMVEVPFTIKYNYKSAGKVKLFSTVGVSSYFMKKEDYDYTITYASWQPYQRSYRYNTAATELFCAINASAGFEHRLNKTIEIRFEPYVKIPIKGIGIGSLPITSAGVNIGITKKLF